MTAQAAPDKLEPFLTKVAHKSLDDKLLHVLDLTESDRLQEAWDSVHSLLDGITNVGEYAPGKLLHKQWKVLFKNEGNLYGAFLQNGAFEDEKFDKNKIKMLYDALCQLARFDLDGTDDGTDGLRREAIAEELGPKLKKYLRFRGVSIRRTTALSETILDPRPLLEIWKIPPRVRFGGIEYADQDPDALELLCLLAKHDGELVSAAENDMRVARLRHRLPQPVRPLVKSLGPAGTKLDTLVCRCEVH